MHSDVIRHPTMRLLRLSKKMSYNDLSILTGISSSHLCLLESGKRGLSYDIAIVIAKAFNMKPDDLFLNDEKLALEISELEKKEK